MTRILGLIAATLIAAPMAASAQETTLDYQGYVMGGTSTTYIYPATVPPPLTPLSQIESAPKSTIATFDATVIYSGSVAQNNLVIDSYQVNLTANNGQNFEIQDIGGGIDAGFYTMNGTSSCIGGPLKGCINLTTSGDAVTGATINLAFNAVQGAVFNLSIGPSGDAFSSTDGYIGESGVNCINSAIPGTYIGSFRASPCTMNVSNPTAGVWTQAPEIAPAAATSGLLLLLGGVVVLRGRRATLSSVTAG